MKSFLPFIFLFISSITVFGQTKFSKKDILEDLETLRSSLEETHFNLYAYTSQQSFEKTYHGIKKDIQQDSLSLLESTNLFQQLISVVNNGHTFIDFPAQSYIGYVQSGGTIFPLEIVFENNRAYIRKNWSSNQEVEAGLEILSINGKSIDTIASLMYPQISAERPYFKNAKIEFYSFPRYYWQVFGEQNAFTIEVKKNEKMHSYQLESIKALEDFEAKRSEIFWSERQLKFIDKSAYLNPGAFSGDEEQYRSFIDSSFIEIKKAGSKNLIIDLRNNTGGNDSFSDYLVSHIANEPFKWCSSFMVKTSKTLKEFTLKNSDTTTTYSKAILSHKDGEIYAPKLPFYEPQEKEKRFGGKVYVLVNRQSYSQSAVTAAQIQDYNWGTIVGEETGEYPSLYASIFQFPLPNTGITVNVSKGHIVRVNGSEKEEGVIPDIVITDHLIDDTDEILEGLVERIHKAE
nr:S41 family peptidase [uncultured Allomuricauda sp.]